jgi:hypothetical protein
MRKIFTILSLFIAITSSSNAQTPVFCDDFNNFDTLSGANYNGWTLTYYTVGSYYTSTQSSALSGPNSYKFGVDSATATTPSIAGADHISFWMKGNASTGGSLANGAFYVYETSDGVNFNLLEMINPIPAGGTGMWKQYTLTTGTTNIKFFYDKDSGNVAFDDFCATIGPLNVGINEVNVSPALTVFPNPSKGLTTVDFKGMLVRNASITVNNVLGKEVKKVALKGNETNYVFDLSEFQNGVYFVKFKSDTGEKTQRMILRK